MSLKNPQTLINKSNKKVRNEWQIRSASILRDLRGCRGGLFISEIPETPVLKGIGVELSM